MADPDLSYSRLTHLPERPIQRLQRPLLAFTHVESASGILLLVCTAIALVAANSGFAEAYAAFWNQEFSFSIDGFELAYPLWYWVNDGLMPIFFFIIGLEIKRELVIGEQHECARHCRDELVARAPSPRPGEPLGDVPFGHGDDAEIELHGRIGRSHPTRGTDNALHLARAVDELDLL